MKGKQDLAANGANDAVNLHDSFIGMFGTVRPILHCLSIFIVFGEPERSFRRHTRGMSMFLAVKEPECTSR